MTIFRMLAMLALTLGLLVPSLAFADDEMETEEVTLPWVRNVAEAKAQAAREGKDLVINFTGSDWCGWCMKLDEEVFDHAEFVNEATKKFVFVFLDFPKSPELKEAVVDAELNQKLQADYGIRGFPSIVLTTADGTPYGRTGYQKGGPEAYLEHLTEIQTKGAAVKKMLADKAHADATALKDGFQVLADAGLLCYPDFSDVLTAAEKADPDGSLGMLALVQAEREKPLAEEEVKGLRELLPRGAEPDWDKVYAYLLDTKYITGVNYLNLVFHIANKFIDEDRAADAKKLLESAKRDDTLTTNDRAKEGFAELMSRIENGSSSDDDGK